MSQFILFTISKDISSKNIEFEPIESIRENHSFLNHFANLLFKGRNGTKVFTIPNFDAICVNAQEQIAENVDIESTVLWNILSELREEEIYCWYGSEADYLDEVESFSDLIEMVRKSLLVGSGEIYFHFNKNSILYSNNKCNTFKT